jgi:hypothetical protein
VAALAAAGRRFAGDALVVGTASDSDLALDLIGQIHSIIVSLKDDHRGRDDDDPRKALARADGHLRERRELVASWVARGRLSQEAADRIERGKPHEPDLHEPSLIVTWTAAEGARLTVRADENEESQFLAAARARGAVAAITGALEAVLAEDSES